MVCTHCARVHVSQRRLQQRGVSFSVGGFEVFRPCHRATQRHQRTFSFQYHNKAVPCPRMVYPPRNLVQKIACCTLHASRAHHLIPNLYAFFLLPLTPTPRQREPSHSIETLLALHARSPSFLGQQSTSISKTWVS
ncbi:hypothetical protein ARMGADRAFT_312810 [Armillaria gallica]|uniref:Uncharacterized protein n=1 Tax=Armillaria gallica TaxID=47427 RepID=A0A2H3D4W8_ARMGA|nr:hypothetical protein ARMGADRAFT_312810 [Armillaria gallica]